MLVLRNLSDMVNGRGTERKINCGLPKFVINKLDYANFDILNILQCCDLPVLD